MDERVDYSMKRRTYVRCTVLKPGGTSAVVNVRADCRDPLTVALPDDTESFSFFERVEGYFVVDGKAMHIQSDEDFNFSRGLYYPSATPQTSKEFADANPHWGDCLGHQPEQPMVRTRGGNWYALMPDDRIVNRKI